MPTLFFSYCHADGALRDQLEKQLTMLKRQGVIETWHDRRIVAGTEFATAIDAHVEHDDIILLLASPDFLASEYCYSIEMARAMERHASGEAVVIPVILRPCEWQEAPFGKLQGTPKDGKPVTLAPGRDQAFLEVAQAIRKAAGEIGGKAPAAPPLLFKSIAPATDVGAAPAGPRSSNLRLAKDFSERERDQFKSKTFDYIARYFENSLGELEGRNQGIEGAFRRVDANRFTAVIYKSGKAVARCTVFMGGDRLFGSGIAYVHGETTESNGYNESLSVEADDQAMYLTSMGMASIGRSQGRDTKLSQEGAAELYWEMLIRPLQRDW